MAVASGVGEAGSLWGVALASGAWAGGVDVARGVGDGWRVVVGRVLGVGEGERERSLQAAASKAITRAASRPI